VFERFTDRAREAVVHAQDEARRLRHDYIGTEHLLLGILRDGSGVGARVLYRLGIDLDGIRSDVRRLIGGLPEGATSDADALRSLGIDLDEVRRRVEEAFGPGALDRPRGSRWRRTRCGPLYGHVPFTPRAKKVLELSLREAKALGHAYIGTEHILLGLVREREGLAARILIDRGVDDGQVRRLVEEVTGHGKGRPGRSA
jgi:ATP-dependent Clp protease ATP-binding subunit ClpA